MRHHLIGAVTAAIVSTIATTPSATADDLVVETAVRTAYYTDPSFDVISEYNAHSNFNFGAAWDFQRLSGLRLGVMLQIMPRLATSRFDGDLRVNWGQQRALGTAEWGFDLWSWLRPFAGVGLGYAHQFLSLDTTGPRLKDHAHDLTAFAGAGIDVGLPVRWGRIGLASSIGYELQTNARFDELRHDRNAFDHKYAPDDDPWDRARADFGTLRTNGLYWTLGLRVEFGL